MKFGIDLGHTLRGANTGAEGIRKETDLNREVGFRVIEKLQRLGYEVINCTLDEASSNAESLSYRVNTANSNNVDVFFSVHFNCSNGQGHGVECFAMSSTGKEYAQRIVDEIANIGYRNRGIKDGSGLYVVKNTNMPASLIECCFIDNEEDMNRYDAEAMAVAIVKGITGQEVRENNFDPIQYMMTYRDLVEAYASNHSDFIEFAKWHYENYGRAEISERRR
jgi:N-acetylmuramoyl-L-alanine amidase